MIRLLDYRRLLYDLKQSYGHPVSVYKVVVDKANLQTGQLLVVEKKVDIRKAIVLPVNSFLKFFRHPTIVDFEYGGDLNILRRIIIIDERDCKRDELNPDSTAIICDHKRYKIESVNDFEFKEAYYVVAQHLAGQRTDEQICISIMDWLYLEDITASNAGLPVMQYNQPEVFSGPIIDAPWRRR